MGPGLFPIPVQPDKGLDVSGERKKVEGFDALQRKSTRTPEGSDLLEQALEATSEIHQASGRRGGQGLEERSIESLTGWINDHHVHIAQALECVTGFAADDRGPPGFVGGPRSEAERESFETRRAAFIEANFCAAPEQPEADGADAAIVFGDSRVFGDERPDAIDRRFEEREMVLTESSRGKEYLDAADRFDAGGCARKALRRRPEDGVRSLGLGVEEESLNSVAQALLQDAREVAQYIRGSAAADEDDL